MTNNLKELYQKYYKNEMILDLITKSMKNREIIFSSDKWWFRGLKVNNLLDLKANMKRYDLLYVPSRIFHSLALLKMPDISLITEEKRKQIKNFNTNFYNLTDNFDFCMDFDVHEKKLIEKYPNELVRFNLVICELQRTAEFFDTTKIKYRMKCSGSGFHFEIPNPVRENREFSINQQLHFFNIFASMIKDMLQLETIDTTIYDIRRIWKTAFTIDTKTYNVALPIKNSDINEFTYANVELKNVLDIIEDKNNKRFDYNDYFKELNNPTFNRDKERRQDLFDVWNDLFGREFEIDKNLKDEM